MMKPLACGIALTFVFATYTKQVYYIESVVFIGFYILYSIGYQNIGKKSYCYISNEQGWYLCVYGVINSSHIMQYINNKSILSFYHLCKMC